MPMHYCKANDFYVEWKTLQGWLTRGTAYREVPGWSVVLSGIETGRTQLTHSKNKSQNCQLKITQGNKLYRPVIVKKRTCKRTAWNITFPSKNRKETQQAIILKFTIINPLFDIPAFDNASNASVHPVCPNATHSFLVVAVWAPQLLIHIRSPW